MTVYLSFVDRPLKTIDEQITNLLKRFSKLGLFDRDIRHDLGGIVLNGKVNLLLSLHNTDIGF